MSEAGHKNFLYPSSEKISIEKGTKVSRVSWVSISGLTPVRVETKKIFELCQSQDYKKYSVVWIDKENVYHDKSILSNYKSK